MKFASSPPWKQIAPFSDTSGWSSAQPSPWASSISSLPFQENSTALVSAPPKIVTMCDTDRIREAIDNLVSNAIKYSPIGGNIAVAVTHDDDGTIIRVTDDGAGTGAVTAIMRSALSNTIFAF